METNKYSGKPLSEVPYDEINIGMEAISYVGNPGKVVSKHIAEHRDGNQWIVIDWENGKSSNDIHACFDKVKVK